MAAACCCLGLKTREGKMERRMSLMLSEPRGERMDANGGLRMRLPGVYGGESGNGRGGTGGMSSVA